MSVDCSFLQFYCYCIFGVLLFFASDNLISKFKKYILLFTTFAVNLLLLHFSQHLRVRHPLREGA